MPNVRLVAAGVVRGALDRGVYDAARVGRGPAAAAAAAPRALSRRNRRVLLKAAPALDAPLERLATADTFGSVGLSRREALWHVRGEVVHQSLPLFTSAGVCEQGDEAGTQLPLMPPSEHVIQDYQTARLSLNAHPMLFLREGYRARRILPTAQAVLAGNGRRVETAGLVLVRQRPGSANGVVFITIEDETGIANLVVWQRVLERFRPIVMNSRILHVKGRVQTADNVTHIVAEQLFDCSADLALLSEDTLRDPLKGVLARADEVLRPVAEGRNPPPRRETAHHPRNVRVIPKSRDFH